MCTAGFGSRQSYSNNNSYLNSYNRFLFYFYLFDYIYLLYFFAFALLSYFLSSFCFVLVLFHMHLCLHDLIVTYGRKAMPSNLNRVDNHSTGCPTQYSLYFSNLTSGNTLISPAASPAGQSCFLYFLCCQMSLLGALILAPE